MMSTNRWPIEVPLMVCGVPGHEWLTLTFSGCLEIRNSATDESSYFS